MEIYRNFHLIKKNQEEEELSKLQEEKETFKMQTREVEHGSKSDSILHCTLEGRFPVFT